MWETFQKIGKIKLFQFFVVVVAPDDLKIVCSQSNCMQSKLLKFDSIWHCSLLYAYTLFRWFIYQLQKKQQQKA